MHLDSRIEEKLKALQKWFEGKPGVLVAFSGGVDSSLVAAVAHYVLGDKAVAVTAESATLAPWELGEARRVAEKLGVRHRVITVNELANPGFASNPPNRCYMCKKELIVELKRVAAELGLGTIVDGTNADDLKVHRPGALALREEGVHSPLAEVGVTKDEVRKLAKHLGLPTAEKPSMACLASRFPYGQRITAESLRRVAEAEAFIQSLTGVRQLRVRDHNGIARIEVDPSERRLFFDEERMDRVAERLKALGFRYITIDLQGYRSGSLDEVLPEKLVPNDARNTKPS